MSEENKIAELLKPRYLVIADYPQRPFNDNEVIEFKDVDFKDRPIYNMGVERDDIIWVKPEYFDQYPHLFRKLSWWEHRTIEELESVKYVKVIEYRGYWRVDDIVPVLSFEIGGIEKAKPYGYILKYKHWQPIYELEPASHQDYLTYINR